LTRSKERIPLILERLRKIWIRFPDLRLGQLIENVFSCMSSSCIYYLEDDELLDEMEEFYNKIKDLHQIDRKKNQYWNKSDDIV